MTASPFSPDRPSRCPPTVIGSEWGRALLDHGPAVAFVKDESGRLVYVNRRLEELLAGDWQGKGDDELWPEPVARRLQAHDRTVLATGQSRQFVEEIHLPDRAPTTWLTYKFPLTDPSGRSMIGGVAIDITERTRGEAVLRQRDEELRQSQKLEAIGTLAGGVAHEFNNLLQAVQGFTQFAMDGLDPSDQRYQDLEQVLEAADRAATLTRQLLGFSRRQVMEWIDVDVNHVVQAVVNMLRPLIGEHIALNLVLSDAANVVNGDQTQLQQLLLNLCVNARDAMPRGGQLLVKTECVTVDREYCEFHSEMQPGRYVVLTVADGGTGIPKEDLSHIFEPFFTTKDIGLGTGLGLANVYGIVQQHRGHIRVYSEVGIGTTFRIYLPIVDHPANVAKAPVHVPSTRGSELILVAEDEPLVRDVAVRILQRAGYRTLVAKDGAEAISLFQSLAPEISLALLDVVMPKWNGHDVYQQLKTIRPDVKGIFCSGYDPETVHLGFITASGVRLLQKPFDPQRLLSTVREVLDETSPSETAPRFAAEASSSAEQVGAIRETINL